MELPQAAEGYLLLKSSRVSATTIEADKTYLKQFIGWHGSADVRDVTAQDVRKYLTGLVDRGLAPHTVKRHHATLSVFYGWLTSSDVSLADVNPVREVPPPRLPKLKRRRSRWMM